MRPGRSPARARGGAEVKVWAMRAYAIWAIATSMYIDLRAVVAATLAALGIVILLATVKVAEVKHD